MELTTQPPYNFKEGALLLIEKPYRWTSFQLVKKVRTLVKQKVGHAGTLDPLATGLMLLGVGKYTKKLEQLQGLDKEYTGTIKLGATTESYDREKPEQNQIKQLSLNEAEIKAATQHFTGSIQQVPPMYSAIKRDGKKLYEYARKGKTILRGAREIEIEEFSISKIDLPFVNFKIACSKGTYIRSIANDYGEQLGVGGYLYDLRRTRIGHYGIEDAWSVKEFEEWMKATQS